MVERLPSALGRLCDCEVILKYLSSCIPRVATTSWAEHVAA